MKKYASDTPEARELVSELEFVWDQVKLNSRHHSTNASNASNTYTPSTPTQHSQSQLQQQQSQPQQQQQQQVQLQMHYPVVHHSPPPSPTSAPVSKYRQEPSRPPDYMDDPDYRGYQSSGDYEHLINPGQPYYEQSNDAQEPQRHQPLRRMKVGSRGTRSMQSGEEDGRSRGEEIEEDEGTFESDEDDEDDELFEGPGIARLHQHMDQDDDEEVDEDGYRSRLVLGRDTSPDMGTMRWQLRVERALTKMSAEIAALREQLEIRNTHVLQNSSSWFWSPHSDSSRRQSVTTYGAKKEVVGVGKRFGKVVWQVIWNVFRHLMVDAVVVGIVVWWMGRRDDRRAGEIWRWLTRVIGSRRRRRGDGGQSGGGVGELI